MHSTRSRIAFVALLLALTGLGVVFLTPPQWVLRRLAIASADSLMVGSVAEDGRLKRMTGRVVAAYIQAGMASQLAARVGVRDEESEIEALGRIVVFVRDNIVNQNQFRHRVKAWPSLVAGAGYCDQINAAAAMLAAQRFDKAEIYALYDQRTRRSPHTIGRVWSSKQEQWLYFDAFFDKPVIFTKVAGGAPVFMKFSAPPATPARGVAPAGLYSLGGFVLADFPPTFGGFLLSRLRTNGAQHAASVPYAPDPDEPGPQTRAATPKGPASVGAAPRREDTELKDRIFRQVARAYVAARVDQLFGRPSGAEYRRIANTPSVELDPRAARIARLSRCIATQEVAVQQ